MGKSRGMGGKGGEKGMANNTDRKGGRDFIIILNQSFLNLHFLKRSVQIIYFNISHEF